jgi:hypothetical protein
MCSNSVTLALELNLFQGSATLEVPAAPAAAAGCQAALHFIHEETLGHCWDRRKRLCDDMYRGDWLPGLV